MTLLCVDRVDDFTLIRLHILQVVHQCLTPPDTYRDIVAALPLIVDLAVLKGLVCGSIAACLQCWVACCRCMFRVFAFLACACCLSSVRYGSLVVHESMR